jgi:hypothetical protein
MSVKTVRGIIMCLSVYIFEDPMHLNKMWKLWNEYFLAGMGHTA